MIQRVIDSEGSVFACVRSGGEMSLFAKCPPCLLTGMQTMDAAGKRTMHENFHVLSSILLFPAELGMRGLVGVEGGGAIAGPLPTCSPHTHIG